VVWAAWTSESNHSTLNNQKGPAVPGLFNGCKSFNGAAATGMAAIAVTIYTCYRFAHKIIAVLGPRGTNVMMRLSAFILLCIGIQILWGGWRELSTTMQ
jgi:small neutral amino acid transporter SnatA (MarC family)